MRGKLWTSAAATIVAMAVTARADEPRPGIFRRAATGEVAQAGFHKHFGTAGCCGASSCGSSTPCGNDDVKIGYYIDKLLHGEKAIHRKWAACKLDCYNWTQHPEIVSALTYAMQSDCDPHVRLAAASSLKQMRVSEPDAVGAMQFSRREDPNCIVRLKAKLAAKKAECSRPPMLTYVSSYGPATTSSSSMSNDFGSRPGPSLEPAPATEPVLRGLSPKTRIEPEPTPAPKKFIERDEPEPSPKAKEDGQEAKRSVRTMMTNVVSKVRSRL